MKKIVIMLMSLSLLFTQEPCEGTCFSDEEVKSLFGSITTLEEKDNLNSEIIKSLDKEIKLYIEQDMINQSIIKDYELKVKIQDELIKEIEPKWYENKWLWFGFGVVFTTTSVHLAGQVN
jgi:hypothetical protein|tara:strand:- start:198 stop:557 length:360 start_codon:yes stop_codon:yes gene_type:complete